MITFQHFIQPPVVVCSPRFAKNSSCAHSKHFIAPPYASILYRKVTCRPIICKVNDGAFDWGIPTMDSQINPVFSTLNLSGDSGAKLSDEFPPTNGGDFTLRSRDKTHFSVHRFLLSLASPIFRDMLSIGDAQNTELDLNKEKPVAELDETARTIQIMLCCIYPNKEVPDLRSDLDSIALALRAAHKYEMPKLTQILSNAIMTPKLSIDNAQHTAGPTHLTEHPLRCYAFGRMWGIPALSHAAIRVASHMKIEDWDNLDAGCAEVDNMSIAWFRHWKKASLELARTRKTPASPVANPPRIAEPVRFTFAMRPPS